MENQREDEALGRLTPREREVLALLRLGLTNQEIAGRLGISADGAKYHVSEIISKLGVRDRYEAASWPERRPWWTAALTPAVLLWRRAGALVPIKLSSLAAAASVGLLATALGGIGLIAFLMVRSGNEPGSGASQEVIDPVAVSSVLQQLAPGTTLHTVEVVYRRHGPETPPEAGPETLRTEAWVEFDETGALASYRSETRNAADDTIFQTAALDGDDLVIYNADGTERKRIADFRLGLTVSSLKGRIAEAITKMADALAAQPDAPTTTLDGTSVRLLEERRPFSRPPIVGEGYSIPHVADLNAVEELRREYILPDASHELKTEVVIVGEDGTETVVESREHRVFEVVEAAS